MEFGKYSSQHWKLLPPSAGLMKLTQCRVAFREDIIALRHYVTMVVQVIRNQVSVMKQATGHFLSLEMPLDFWCVTSLGNSVSVLSCSTGTKEFKYVEYN